MAYDEQILKTWQIRRALYLYPCLIFPFYLRKSNSKFPLAPSSSSAIALSNFLQSASVNESKGSLVKSPNLLLSELLEFSRETLQQIHESIGFSL